MLVLKVFFSQNYILTAKVTGPAMPDQGITANQRNPPVTGGKNSVNHTVRK
jgi:hypothetical protein